MPQTRCTACLPLLGALHDFPLVTDCQPDCATSQAPGQHSYQTRDTDYRVRCVDIWQVLWYLDSRLCSTCLALAPYQFAVLIVNRDQLANMPASNPAARGLHMRAEVIAFTKEEAPDQTGLNVEDTQALDWNVAVKLTIADWTFAILVQRDLATHNVCIHGLPSAVFSELFSLEARIIVRTTGVQVYHCTSAVCVRQPNVLRVSRAASIDRNGNRDEISFQKSNDLARR